MAVVASDCSECCLRLTRLRYCHRCVAMVSFNSSSAAAPPSTNPTPAAAVVTSKTITSEVVRPATPSGGSAATSGDDSNRGNGTLLRAPSDSLLPGFTSSFVRAEATGLTAGTGSASAAGTPAPGSDSALVADGVVDGEAEEGGEEQTLAAPGTELEEDSASDEEVEEQVVPAGAGKAAKTASGGVALNKAAVPSGRELVHGLPVSSLERELSRHAVNLASLSAKPVTFYQVPKVSEQAIGLPIHSHSTAASPL